MLNNDKNRHKTTQICTNITIFATPKVRKKIHYRVQEKPKGADSVYKCIATAPPMYSFNRKGKAFLPIFNKSKKEIK